MQSSSSISRARCDSWVQRGAFALTLAAAVVSAVPAQAQGIDEALRLYERRDYKAASLALYEVLATEANPDTRDKAQIYLAETLRKMQLWVPALFYYNDIFQLGRQNRYYLNAVEGLLAIQELWHDPIVVPSLINNFLDPEGLSQLDPLKIAQVNYMVGELSYRQGKSGDAKAFLEYVPPESPLHPKAKYLLGLLEIRAGNHTQALTHFQDILRLVQPNTPFSDLKSLRNLAIIAAARTTYGEGRYAEATEYYKMVPRFSEDWFTAMYENAWAYFQQGEYGRSLGELQSVTSPYFKKRHVPEVYVIAATTFFVNCQWDRVRREVEGFRRNYDPMVKQLETYLGAERDPVEYYQDVVKGGAGKFELELARVVRRIKRFRDYHYMLSHIYWEQEFASSITEWKGTELGKAVADVLAEQRGDLEPAVGAWVQLQLRNQLNSLGNFQNQINILDFEVADAERKWLEQGQEILKGRRARLPRPKIPSDQWQHWEFEEEYWKDELGFIQFTLATECLEQQPLPEGAAGASQ